MPEITVNGHRFHYENVGRGPVLLLIPGMFGTGLGDFGPQLDQLSPYFSIVAPDPRGYGQSRPPDRDFPTEYLRRDAHDMRTLMLALGYKTFYVTGWSDGGNAALLMAMDYPELVTKLVVWGTNTFLGPRDMECLSTIRNLSDWSERARKPLEREYGKVLPVLWNDYLAAQDTLFAAGGEICRNRLPEIACPTLVLHGDKDPLVPGFHAEIIAASISKSVLVRFPEGRHNCHIKFAREFNERLRTFLSIPCLGPNQNENRIMTRPTPKH